MAEPSVPSKLVVLVLATPGGEYLKRAVILKLRRSAESLPRRSHARSDPIADTQGNRAASQNRTYIHRRWRPGMSRRCSRGATAEWDLAVIPASVAKRHFPGEADLLRLTGSIMASEPGWSAVDRSDELRQAIKAR